MERRKQTKTIYVGILIFINLLFSACTTISDHKNTAVPVEDRTVVDTISQADSQIVTNDEITVDSTQTGPDPEAGIYSEESIVNKPNSPVALAFLEDAEKYASAGDSGRAVASLERGLDIEPKNPWLWNRLATERLKQKMWDKAITLAKKSNAFASGHDQLLRDNWQIIAKARLALGDTEGAKKANEMVWQFSREKT